MLKILTHAPSYKIDYQSEFDAQIKHTEIEE